MKKPQLVAMIVAVVAVVGFIAWYASHNAGQVAQNPTPQQAVVPNPQAALNANAGLGAQVYNQVGQNPVKGNIPDANPVNQNTNPYSNAYKNPFAQ